MDSLFGPDTPEPAEVPPDAGQEEFSSEPAPEAESAPPVADQPTVVPGPESEFLAVIWDAPPC